MIHSTAIVDPAAKIGTNVEIGPYSIIGPDVEIGDNSVVGPHTFNFLQATADAIAAGAALRVDDADGLAAAIGRVFGDSGELGAMRAAALRFAAAHRGATARTVALIRAAITG